MDHVGTIEMMLHELMLIFSFDRWSLPIRERKFVDEHGNSLLAMRAVDLQKYGQSM